MKSFPKLHKRVTTYLNHKKYVSLETNRKLWALSGHLLYSCLRIFSHAFNDVYIGQRSFIPRSGEVLL